MYEHPADTGVVMYTYNDAYELANGRIAVCASARTEVYVNLQFREESPQPSLITLAPDGLLLAQATFIKPGYFSYNPVVVENGQGDLFAIIAYNPDLCYLSTNYFKSFENPTDHAIIAFYKLNDDLSIAENHEFEFLVDTFECRNNSWYNHPNESSGHAYLISFLDDENNIVGGFLKVASNVGWGEDPRGYDSTFFFRMSLEGEMLDVIAYEMATSGKEYNNGENCERPHQIVKDENGHFIFYMAGSNEFKLFNPAKETALHGYTKANATYLNSKLYLLNTKELCHSIAAYYSKFQFISTIRSTYGTTYPASNYSNWYETPYEVSSTLYDQVSHSVFLEHRGSSHPRPEDGHRLPQSGRQHAQPPHGPEGCPRGGV